MADRGDKMKLVIYQCPAHKYWAIALESQDGSGLRLTPSKCCGSWKTVKSWQVTDSMKTDIQRSLSQGKV